MGIGWERKWTWCSLGTGRESLHVKGGMEIRNPLLPTSTLCFSDASTYHKYRYIESYRIGRLKIDFFRIHRHAQFLFFGSIIIFLDSNVDNKEFSYDRGGAGSNQLIDLVVYFYTYLLTYLQNINITKFRQYRISFTQNEVKCTIRKIHLRTTCRKSV